MFYLKLVLLIGEMLVAHSAFAADNFGDILTSNLAEKTARLTMYKKFDQYTVEKIEVILADIPYETTYRTFKGRVHNGCIISFRGDALGCFGIETIEPTLCRDRFLPGGAMTGGCEVLSEGRTVVSIPYFPNGKYADIYNPKGKKILTVSLTGKATCNEDNVCNRPIEDRSNCRQDCKDGEPGAGLSASQKAQEQAGNDSPKEISWKRNVAGIFVFMVFVGGVLFLWWRWRQYRSTLNNR